jgi:excisionase family DNA binding protein
MRKKSDNQLDLDQRLAFTINHSADALDVGRSTVYELIKAGKLKVIEVNGMRRISGESLRALVTEQESI